MLRYVGDYGLDTITVPLSAPIFQSDGTIVYAVTAGGHALRVAIRDSTCQDIMSGEEFTHVVVVRVDSRDLSGCGRALDSP